VAIAGVVSLLVAGVALLHVTGSAFYAQTPQSWTLGQIKAFDDEVQLFRKKHGKLPRSLRQLQTRDTEIWFDQRGNVLDYWEHLLVYRVQGNRYQIISYGADGRPGGIGLNHDLTNALAIEYIKASAKAGLGDGNSHFSDIQPETHPTFLQLLFSPLSTGVIISSLICGALTFLLVFFQVKAAHFEKNEWIDLAAGLVSTLIFAAIVAFFITMLHIPSGH
jgi:hypothetical protein